MPVNPTCCPATTRWFTGGNHTHPAELPAAQVASVVDQYIPATDGEPLAPVEMAWGDPPIPQEVNLAAYLPRRDPFVAPRLTSGERAVAQARALRGRRSAPALRQRLPHFQAVGGVNLNCADFVSSVQQNSGRLRHHHIGVPELEKGLQHEGWQRVLAREARPGDVWISSALSHTELVATPGGTRLIGSNNNGRSYQTITEHAHDPSQGHYWGRR